MLSEPNLDTFQRRFSHHSRLYLLIPVPFSFFFFYHIYFFSEFTGCSRLDKAYRTGNCRWLSKLVKIWPRSKLLPKVLTTLVKPSPTQPLVSDKDRKLKQTQRERESSGACERFLAFSERERERESWENWWRIERKRERELSFEVSLKC